MKIYLEKIHLDLTVNWKLSRNATTFKENFIVHLDTEAGELLSEIAPNIRYGETPNKIEEEFKNWLASTDIKKIINLESLQIALTTRPLLHALQFGLESVFINYFAVKKNQSISDYLGLSKVPKSVKTSFSLPIMPIEEIKGYLNKISRFEHLKVKIDATSATDIIKEIKKYSHAKLRIDGNEAFKSIDDYLKFEKTLKDVNVELIEQPFPSTMQLEYKELKSKTPYILLADESIEDVGDFTKLGEQFHAINVKLMKTGSLIKARDLINLAHQNKMQTMIGCMIETSLGISYGMLFSGMCEYVDLDGFLLIKDEPFKLVRELEGKLSLT